MGQWRIRTGLGARRVGGVSTRGVVADDSADHSLWRGLLARDSRALEALIARYSREIAYFVRMVLDGVGTPQDVEECVSDLFVAAWEEAASFDPTRGALRTWLMMRVKYLALDRRRQIQRRQALTVPVVAPARDADEAALERVADGESLDGLIERRERQAQLRRALESLPTLDRTLVYLRYFRLA